MDGYWCQTLKIFTQFFECACIRIKDCKKGNENTKTSPKKCEVSRSNGVMKVAHVTERYKSAKKMFKEGKILTSLSCFFEIFSMECELRL